MTWSFVKADQQEFKHYIITKYTAVKYMINTIIIAMISLMRRPFPHLTLLLFIRKYCRLHTPLYPPASRCQDCFNLIKFIKMLQHIIKLLTVRVFDQMFINVLSDIPTTNRHWWRMQKWNVLNDCTGDWLTLDCVGVYRLHGTEPLQCGISPVLFLLWQVKISCCTWRHWL